MPVATEEPAVKLQHLQKFRVLLCAKCGYCVLPQALERHLKSIHKLRSAESKRHLQVARSLNLASADDVVYPAPNSLHIPGLPVHKGYECTVPGCQHLCVSAKRMDAHWTESHSGPGTVNTSQRRLRCRPVRIQTFFRGCFLRYFTVATGASTASLVAPPMQVDRNISTTMEWWLTTEFLERGYKTQLPTKATQPSWRDCMLQSSTESQYLRYAILSVTANHIALEHPESRYSYRGEADRFRSLAIRSIPVDASIDVDPSAFFPLFNFSRLMTMSWIGRARLDQKGYIAAPAQSPQASLPPEWVPVQRRGRALTWPHRGRGRIANAVQGPLEQLLDVHNMPDSESFRNPHDGYLDALADGLRAMADFTEVDESCIEALQMLRILWATPYRSEVSDFRDMALMWTARAPEKYIDLVHRHDPVALVVWAHYCVLWKLAERDRWYMDGLASPMLMKVIQCLEREWQDWIEWPINKVIDHANTSTVRSLRRREDIMQTNTYTV